MALVDDGCDLDESSGIERVGFGGAADGLDGVE